MLHYCRVYDMTPRGEQWRRYRRARWYEVRAVIYSLRFVYGWIAMHVRYFPNRCIVDWPTGNPILAYNRKGLVWKVAEWIKPVSEGDYHA